MLTYKQLSLALSVKQGTLKRWKHEGMPAHVLVGKRVRFDLADVRAWIATRKTDAVKLRRLRQVTFARVSCVYFAAMPDGAIKIGWSSDNARRSNEIDGEMIVALDGDKHLEAAFHRTFASDHIEGELFRRGDRLMAFINGLIVMRTKRVA